VTAHLVLATLIIIALRAGFLYLFPFGPCPKCKGTGHISRGPRRRPVCPRCKGRRRIQRHGSRTIHRLVRSIRNGQRAAARYQQHQPPTEGD
jgi:DnaJ-class molecular chaperone